MAETLYESEAGYRAIFDNASDAIFVRDLDGHFLEVSQVACDRYGYTREELLQMTTKEINTPEAEALMGERTKELLSKGHAIVESTHVRRDGKIIPVEVSRRLIHFRGKPAILSIARDITERKRVEEELRQSVDRYYSIFDRMLDGVYRSTHEGKFVDLNPAFVKMFGYSSKQEMLNINIKKELYFAPEERGSHLLDTGQEEVEIYRMRRKDGSEIWVEDHGHYVHDDQGKIIYHEGILRDVTERKQFETSLLALNRHALQLNSARNMEEVIEYTLDAMETAFGFDFDFGDFLSVENGFLRIKGSRGKENTILELPLDGRGLCVLAVKQKIAIRVTDTSKEDTYVDRMGFDWRNEPTMLSELVVPVIVGDEVAGVLNVESQRLEAFNDEDQKLLETLASYVASAIIRLKRDDALRESISLLRATLESTADGTLVVGMNGQVTAFNQRFADLWHIPEKILETRDDPKLLQFVTDQLEDPAKFLGKVHELYSKPEEESFDVLRFRDGREFERYSQPQRLGAKIVGRVWNFRDVTERRRAIEGLRESEERYRLLFERSPVGVGLSTTDGKVISANKAMLDITGYSLEEFSGIDLADTYANPGERTKLFQALDRDGNVTNFRSRLLRKDGTPYDALLNLTRVRVGGLDLFQTVCVDITKQIQMEEELREHAQQLEALQATILEIIRRQDLSRLLNDVVQRACKLLRASMGGLYTCDNEQKTVRCVVSYNTPHNYNGTVLKFGEGAAGHVALTGEPLIVNDYRLWSGRAEVYEADQPFGALLSVPMTWEGRVVGVIHIMEKETRHFTESELKLLTLLASHAAIAIENERQAESLEQIVAERTKDLRKAQDNLLKAERLAAIGQTAAMVGHDLRNPLQAISTATYVLKKELNQPSDRKTDEMIGAIEDSVAYSDRIVRDLLDYSEDLQLEFAETTPNSIVNDAIRQTKIPESVTVSNLTSNGPIMRVDIAKIKRIFVNLIEDAVDAMPKGGQLTFTNKRVDKLLDFEITDTGVGIPKAMLDDLWKPLITTKSKGIGLGLAICKRIADAHGGSISVKSEVGNGTTFTLRLPIAPDKEVVVT